MVNWNKISAGCRLLVNFKQRLRSHLAHLAEKKHGDMPDTHSRRAVKPFLPALANGLVVCKAAYFTISLFHYFTSGRYVGRAYVGSWFTAGVCHRPIT